MKFFIVSDVHGHLDILLAALKEEGYNENNINHKLIVLGDFVDRGPQVKELYQYLRRLQEEGKAIILKGNHEDMLIDMYKDNFSFIPTYNGIPATIQSLTNVPDYYTWLMRTIEQPIIIQPTSEDWNRSIRNRMKKLYPDLKEWLEALPNYYETKNYILTHGSIENRVDWQNSDWEECHWDQGHFINQDIQTNKTVIVGHFGTDHLRKKFNLPMNGTNDYSILKSNDGKKIFIDASTVESEKVNVLVLEDEEL